MKRNISAFGLLCVSISAIMGSGWLFSSFYAAKYAGPASLVSWVIGGVIVIIVAFTFAEVCSMLPISGSSVRIPKYTHGNVVAIVISMVVWLTYITLMVIEALSVIEYLSYFYPWLVEKSGGLTIPGYGFAFIVMAILAVINNYSMRWLINCNAFLTVIKIIVPLMFCALLLFLLFSFDGVIYAGGTSEFAPMGMHGIFYAVAAGGIIFTFNGFKQAAELAGEVRNPQFAVPFAIIGSLVVCLIVYLLLQSSVLVALTPENLAAGWKHIKLSDNNSPLTSLLSQHKIIWFIPILFVTAVLSPFASSLIYCTTSSRTLFGIAINGFLPHAVARVNKKGIPMRAVWINFIIGMFIFTLFKGWDAMSDFITSLLTISYATAPICLVALRSQVPNAKRPLKLPFGFVWSYISLTFSTLFVYWCGWNIIYPVAIFLCVCLFVVLIFQALHSSGKFAKGAKLDWHSSIWMWVYFVGITIISYIGNYGCGQGWLGVAPMMVLIALLSLLVLFLGWRFRMPDDTVLDEIGLIDSGHADD